MHTLKGRLWIRKNPNLCLGVKAERRECDSIAFVFLHTSERWASTKDTGTARLQKFLVKCFNLGDLF